MSIEVSLSTMLRGRCTAAEDRTIQVQVSSAKLGVALGEELMRSRLFRSAKVITKRDEYGQRYDFLELRAAPSD